MSQINKNKKNIKDKDEHNDIIDNIDENYSDIKKYLFKFPKFKKYYNDIESLKNEKFYKAINIKSDTQWNDYLNHFDLKEKIYKDYLLDKFLFRGFNFEDFNLKNDRYIHWYVNAFIKTIGYVKNKFLQNQKYIVNEFVRQLYIVIEMLEKYYRTNDNSIFIFFNIYKHCRYKLIVDQEKIGEHLNIYKEFQNQEEKIKSSEKIKELILKKFDSEIEKLTTIYKRFAYESMINDFVNICNLCKKGYSPNAANFVYNYKALFVEEIDYYIIFPDISKQIEIKKRIKDIYELITGPDYETEKHTLFDFMFSGSNESDNLILTPLFRIKGSNKMVESKIFNIKGISDKAIQVICELYKGYKNVSPAKHERSELSRGNKYHAERNKFIKIRYDYYKNIKGYKSGESRKLVNKDLDDYYDDQLSDVRLRDIIRETL